MDAEPNAKWVACLTERQSGAIDALLALSLGLDVWERRADSLLVAAHESQLVHVEQLGLALVERLNTVDAWTADQRSRAHPGDHHEGEER